MSRRFGILRASWSNPPKTASSLTYMSEDIAHAERERILASLRREREERRATELASYAPAPDPAAAAAADEDSTWEQRRMERIALVQRLLSEREATAAIAAPRIAWEDRLERHTSRIESELGLSRSREESPRKSKPNTPARAGGELKFARSGLDEALEKAARDRAALEADALSLGALGAAELDAIGTQAQDQLERLGAGANGAREGPSAAPQRSGIPSPAPRTAPPYRAIGQPPQPPPPPPPPPAACGGKRAAPAVPAGSCATPRAASAQSQQPARSSTGRLSMGGGGGAGPFGEATAARAESSKGKDKMPLPTGFDACTFQPAINQNSARLVDKDADKRGHGLYARLASQRVEAYAKRELLRMEAEREKLAECTFAPKINPTSAGAKTPAPKGGSGGGGDGTGRKMAAGERLHADSDRRSEMRERTRVASERWELSNHSFAPHINPTSEALAAEVTQSRPIHERIEELQRKKDDNIRALRAKLAEEEDATFAPQINPTSAQLAIAAQQQTSSSMPLELSARLGSHHASQLSSTAGAGRSSAAERLAHDAMLQIERKAQRELQRREAEEQLCTFKPSVNPLSHRLVQEAEASQELPAGVFNRLQRAAEVSDERRRERLQQQREEEKKLFQPTTSEANDILLSARSARLHESELERTERLAYVDAKRREALITQLAQQHYAQYTHKPQIDPISAQLARSKTHAELSANASGKALKATLAKKRESIEQVACPFKPTIDSKSAVLAASAPERISHNPEHVDSLTARLATEQREREERLERIRRKVEADKMKDCTFAPETGKQTPSTAEDKPLIVRGLGRYMELKQMAKRQSEAQKQREQKAFLIEPPSRLHPYTVPEPFVLHEKTRDERLERTRKEVEESRNAECTFTPKINEVSVRSLLRSSAG